MEKLFITLFGFIIGASLGSFIKVLADRSILDKKFTGRSECPKCHKKLNWYELIPIFSYLFLKGKCSKCQTKIPLEYLLIEILTGLLIALLFSFFIPTNILEANIYLQIKVLIDILFKILIVSVLIITFLTDLKTGFIFDRITYPAIVLAFIFLIIISAYNIYMLYLSLINSVIGKYLLPPHSDYFFRHSVVASEPLIYGLIAGFLMLLFFGSIIVFTKGRGMGGGDLKLAIFLGLALGFPLIFVALMLAFLSGSLIGIFLLLFGKKKFGQTIPFGPFLSIGALTTLFVGTQILNWYITKF